MEYKEALKIANRVKEQLAPHCEKIHLVGSLRRRKPEVKDIEFVIVPKEYDTGLFASGIAPVVNQWPKIKGDLPCKHTARQLPEGINLDLYICEQGNYGYMVAIRTGPSDYSKYLMARIKQRGLTPKDGWLWRKSPRGMNPIATPTEEIFYRMIGVKREAPHLRHAPNDPAPTNYVINTDKRAYA